MEDKEILELYNLRDENAITKTKEKYGKKLYNISFNIVREHQYAEECENDTYLRSWNSIPPADPGDCFYAYLVKIIRNLSIDRYRKENSVKRYGNVSELSAELEMCIPYDKSIDSEMDDKIISEAINSFLAGISQEKRKVFVRRYFFCDSVADISKRFGITESKVKSILFRCRNKLKKHLERREIEI